MHCQLEGCAKVVFSTWRANYVIALGGWPIFNCLALCFGNRSSCYHLHQSKSPLNRAIQRRRERRRERKKSTLRSHGICWHCENCSNVFFSLFIALSLSFDRFSLQSFIFIVIERLKEAKKKKDKSRRKEKKNQDSVRSSYHENVRAIANFFANRFWLHNFSFRLSVPFFAFAIFFSPISILFYFEKKTETICRTIRWIKLFRAQLIRLEFFSLSSSPAH